jgi:hypothetical protein
MNKTVSCLLAAAALLSGVCACTFDERDGQVLVALDALTFPVVGADAQTQCASTAAAFGLLGSAVSAFSLKEHTWTASCICEPFLKHCEGPFNTRGHNYRELQHA